MQYASKYPGVFSVPHGQLAKNKERLSINLPLMEPAQAGPGRSQQTGFKGMSPITPAGRGPYQSPK